MEINFEYISALLLVDFLIIGVLKHGALEEKPDSMAEEEAR
jgi:hypothetical protein